MVSIIPISSAQQYQQVITRALDEVNAISALADFTRIIIKPNMVNNSPPQVTTDVRCVMAVVQYLKEHLDTEIVVAEGSGEGSTLDNFKRNNYEQITTKFGVQLLDLDALPVKKYENPSAGEYREIYLPEYLEEAGLVSVPPRQGSHHHAGNSRTQEHGGVPVRETLQRVLVF